MLVLVSEERARKARRPVWITGTGWANDTPTLESRAWGCDRATRKAAEMAFAEAGINDPGKEVDFFEVDDLYAYRELLTLDTLGVRDNRAQVNTSGGASGWGTRWTR